MAQTFRSAFNGFNRDDVAHYIDFINNKHATEVSELRSRISLLETQQEGSFEDAPVGTGESLMAENAALKERIAELELQLSSVPAAASAATTGLHADQELEAYRRAERTERLARERAEIICRQTNAVLADATAKVDSSSAQIGAVMEQLRQQMELLQHAVGSSRQALQDAAATMYSMNPESTDR